MRFNYGEKNPELLAIARATASDFSEIPEHCVMLYENLWRFSESLENPMGLLANRGGIYQTVSAAYALGHHDTFSKMAILLVSKGRALAELVQRPCIAGFELCLAILIDDQPAAREIAQTIVEAPINLVTHPEDAKAILLATLVAGNAVNANELISQLKPFDGLNKTERQGWELWIDVISQLSLPGKATLEKVVTYEDRLVRRELSKVARGKESPLSAVDLVCFYTEAMQALLVNRPYRLP
jgi:hypothetical protein